MTDAFARLDRIQRIHDLTDVHGTRHAMVEVRLNERAVHPPTPPDPRHMAMMGAAQNNEAMMRAQGYEPPPPPPKGRWIASIGRLFADDDDPVRAVELLEGKVVADAERYAKGLHDDRRQRLAEAEQLLRALEEAAPRQSPAKEE